MNENMICENCGCVDEKLFELEINGEIRVVCADCAKDFGFMQCDECGKWVPEEETFRTADGDSICQNCYESSYFTCEDCGKVLMLDSLVVVDRGTRDERYVCDRCADRFYFRCDDCGEYFSGNNVRVDNNDAVICDDCWDNGNWVMCEDCGTILCYDDAHYRDGCYYCDDCYEDYGEAEGFHDYGYKPDPEFQYRSTEQDHAGILTFGVELEVDHGDDHCDLTTDLNELEQPIYMKHDGSLDAEGVEIVTHPASLAYHMYELRWAAIGRTCSSHGYRSHDTTTCGLHIHVGRAQFGPTSRDRRRIAGNLVLLTCRLWSHLVTFSRREMDKLDHWSSCPDLGCAPGGVYTDDELTTMAVSTEYAGRYQAVNLTNDDTVEFRLFRGTLKRDTILASLQLVSNMTHYAMTHTPTECFNAEWAEVIGLQRYDELDSYCQSRGLL